jgi:hypothetical protein
MAHRFTKAQVIEAARNLPGRGDRPPSEPHKVFAPDLKSIAKPQPLDPVDLGRCQVEIVEKSPWIIGGTHRTTRCANKPAWVATEVNPDQYGRRGAMSMCSKCRDVFSLFTPNAPAVTWERIKLPPVVGEWVDGPWDGNYPTRLRATYPYWLGLFDELWEVDEEWNWAVNIPTEQARAEYELGLAHANKWKEEQWLKQYKQNQ